MSMLDRIVGAKRTTDGNGHFPGDADLITSSTQLAARASAWEAVQAARNIKRPHTLDIVGRVFERFQELHGDRGFRDDPAIVGGIAELDGHPVMIVGEQKGASTEENIARNFGMPHPEGYRKAIRLYRLAEKFHLPLITFVDTPGAYPGPEGEERGQAEAIARAIFTMTRLRTPIIVVILGEGGSGGALALAVGDIVLAMQNAIYSVISPEGSASILWRSPAEAERAATAMRLAGPDLLDLGVVDGLIPEPPGGAHTDHDATAKAIKTALLAELATFERVTVDDLLSARYERFRGFGAHAEAGAAAPPPHPEPWWRKVAKLGRP